MTAAQAFAGLRVLDFSWAIAGPLATKYLADHGATVVKVEGRERPDVMRITGPFLSGKVDLDHAAAYFVTSSSKLSLTLSLNRPVGIELARRLVRWADLVVENFSPGVMGRLGLGYEDLRQIKPNIVMVSSSNQGQTGPHAGYRGFGPQVAAMTGLFDLTGFPDGDPVQPEISYPDFTGAALTTMAIIAALLRWQRTGEGQYVDLSQSEATIHFLATELLDFSLNKREAKRNGNRAPDAAPHGAFRCLGDDRWCAIAVQSEEEWRGFCQALGNPAWTREPRFATSAGRKQYEDELERLVGDWTESRSAYEVMELLQREGVPAGVVQNAEDLLDGDPQLRARGYFWPLEVPGLGRCLHPAFPAQFSRTPAALSPAPLLGQHNEYVCKQILGMSDGEYRALVAEGTLE